MTNIDNHISNHLDFVFNEIRLPFDLLQFLNNSTAELNLFLMSLENIYFLLS